MLYNLIIRNRKVFAVLDVLEGLTGFMLAIFLWMHMFFVASIYFGTAFYNKVPLFLEEYYLAQVGIPGVVILFFFHALLASRKIPTAYGEQKIILRHTSLIKHRDTLSWIIQVITGASLFAVASIHFWVILSTGEITYDISAARVILDRYLVFYIILLILGEVHATLGLYRLALKWGWPKRNLSKFLTTAITIGILILGFGALYMFRYPLY